MTAGHGGRARYRPSMDLAGWPGRGAMVAGTDALGRTIDYLRISVTDRCNERCLYCMPQGYRGWERRPDHLTADELVRVVRVAAGVGIRKYRLTGGEPTMRPDLVALARAMAAVPGVEALAVSTNGIRLAALARPLRDSGVTGLNVSLDALDARVYRRITGGDVSQVLAGLRAARDAGFERVKLNCVLMRGVNEDEIWPLARFAAASGLVLRFIELMPVTSTEVLTAANFFPVGEAMSRLREADELVEEPGLKLGWGPARYYRLRQCGAVVGFIGAMTNLHFCDQCNKMRLTADGRLRPCLGNHGELDLRSAVRGEGGDDAVRAVFQAGLTLKPPEHSFRGQYQPSRPMTAIGG